MTITYIAEGGWIKVDRFLDDVSGDEYDALILPGGAWNPDTLRADPKAISFVKRAATADKIIAAICHGPWHVLGDYRKFDSDHGAQRSFDCAADKVVDLDRIDVGRDDVGVCRVGSSF